MNAILFGSAAAGAALLDVVAKGLVLLSVAGVISLAMRRAPASARHLVWLCALACALVLPVGSWLLPGWRVLPGWMRWEVARTAVTSRHGTDGTDGTDAVPTVAAGPSIPLDASVRSIARPTPRNFRIGASALPTIWAAGAALVLGPLMWSTFALARVSRRSLQIRDGRLATQVAAIAREIALPRRIRVLLGDADAMPMVWGILRARLLLPASANEWPEARLRGVLLHELAHLRRRDPLALLIAQLALALHWFNPLVWFAVHRLRAEQERACDDFVLRHGIRPSEYASDLLAVATGLHALPFTTAALTMAHPARLEGRITSILDAARNRRALTRWLIAATALLATAVALPLAMLCAADEKNSAHENGPPHIVSASVADQQLHLEVSAGAVPLLFRVGGGPDAARFANGVPESALRKFSVAFSPKAWPLWERLEIRRPGRALQRLPQLPRGFLPEGKWAWRNAVTRDGERFIFADVLLPHGEKRPVSVEVAAVTAVGEVPFMNVPGSIECEFRIFGVPVGAPQEVTKMQLRAAEKLVEGSSVAVEKSFGGTVAAPRISQNEIDKMLRGQVTAPRVTTKSGQRAIIEIIREFRHEVQPGEFQTDNMGVICEIEPEQLEKGVSAQGKVSLVLFDGVYASVGEAMASVLPAEGKPFVPDASAKVRRLEKAFNADFADDEVLVVNYSRCTGRINSGSSSKCAMKGRGAGEPSWIE